MACRLVAHVVGELAEGEEPKVLQLIGLPPDLADSVDQRQRLPWPRVLVLEEDTEGYSLYRYTESGEFGGDTWHMTLEDAKHQAAYEFGDRLGSWSEVPEEVADPLSFALQQMKEH